MEIKPSSARVARLGTPTRRIAFALGLAVQSALLALLILGLIFVALTQTEMVPFRYMGF